jgi:hypothetical protein
VAGGGWWCYVLYRFLASWVVSLTEVVSSNNTVRESMLVLWMRVLTSWVLSNVSRNCTNYNEVDHTVHFCV